MAFAFGRNESDGAHRLSFGINRWPPASRLNRGGLWAQIFSGALIQARTRCVYHDGASCCPKRQGLQRESVSALPARRDILTVHICLVNADAVDFGSIRLSFKLGAGAMARFFVRNGDNASGPYEAAELKQMAAAGRIVATTFVRREDQVAWVRAKQVTGLLPPVAIEPVDTFEPLPDAPVIKPARALPPTLPSRHEHADAVHAIIQDEDVGRFCRDGQAAAKVREILANIQGILTREEYVEYLAIQSKPMAMVPDYVILTNRRLIFYRAKLLGRMDFSDFLWRELYDAKLQEGLLGSSLSMVTAGDQIVSMDYLPKDQARGAYRICQEREEEAAETRRNRRMEEKRSGAASVVTNISAASSTPALPAPVADDPVAKLQSLKRMLDAGLITEDEYNAKKMDILSRM